MHPLQLNFSPGSPQIPRASSVWASPHGALGPPATLLGASQAGSGIAHVDGLPVPWEEGELPQVAGLNADMASGAEDEEIGNAEMVLAADRQSLQLQVVKTTEEAAQVGQRMSPAPPPPPPPHTHSEIL